MAEALVASILYGIVAAPLAEASVWEERRQAVRGRGAEGSDGIRNYPQLAQLPTVQSGMFSGASPAVTPSQSPIQSGPSLPKDFQVQTLASQATSRLPAWAQNLPLAYASFRHAEIPSSWKPGDRLVLHLQDAHLNPAAQKNIAQSVQHFIDQGRPELVALEGAFGRLNVEGFRGFKDRVSVRKVADRLFKDGKISGAVHTAFTSAAKIPPFIGVDDSARYDANVNAYRQSYSRSAALKENLENVRKAMDQRKASVFNPELRMFDGKMGEFNAADLTLGEYLSFVAATAPRVPQSLRLFIRAYEMEKQLDFTQVEKDRAELLKKLSLGLSPMDLDGLVTASLAYRLGRVSGGDFYAYLKELCRRSGTSLSGYPAMQKYLEYIFVAESIHAETLFEDMVRTEESEYARLSHTPEEKALVRQSRAAGLMAKLVQFSLSPQEWREYLALVPEVEAIQSAAAAGGAALDLGSFEAFFREAVERDAAMTENLLKAMDSENSTTAILVTGGFHSSGIGERLKQKGVAVLTLSPKIGKVDLKDASAYLSAFAREKTPLDKLFAGEKLFVSPLVLSPSTVRDGAALLSAAQEMANGSKTEWSGEEDNATFQSAARAAGKDFEVEAEDSEAGATVTVDGPQAAIRYELDSNLQVVEGSTKIPFWSRVTSLFKKLSPVTRQIERSAGPMGPAIEQSLKAAAISAGIVFTGAFLGVMIPAIGNFYADVGRSISENPNLTVQLGGIFTLFALWISKNIFNGPGSKPSAYKGPDLGLHTASPATGRGETENRMTVSASGLGSELQRIINEKLKRNLSLAPAQLNALIAQPRLNAGTVASILRGIQLRGGEAGQIAKIVADFKKRPSRPASTPSSPPAGAAAAAVTDVDLPALGTEEAVRTGLALRRLLDEIAFDAVNSEIRSEAERGDYWLFPYPHPNSPRNPDGIRQRFRELMRGSSERALLNRARLAYEFFVLGTELSETELNDVLGAQRGLLTEMLGLNLAVSNSPGRFRMNGLSLVSRQLPDGSVIYIFADTPPYLPSNPGFERVYIGPDSFDLLNYVSEMFRPSGRVVEMGSGSGIQLISALVQFPRIRKAIGLEIDARARNVSRFNAALNGVHQKLAVAETMESLERELERNPIDFAMSNPPFIAMPEFADISAADRAALSGVAEFVQGPSGPQVAIRSIFAKAGWGGKDGLAVTGPFLDFLFPRMSRDGIVVIYSQFPGGSSEPSIIREFIRSRGGYGMHFDSRREQERWAPTTRGGVVRAMEIRLMPADRAAISVGRVILQNNPSLTTDAQKLAVAHIVEKIYHSHLEQGISHFHDGFVVAYREPASPAESGRDPGLALMRNLAGQFGAFGKEDAYKFRVGPLVENFGLLGLALATPFIPSQYRAEIWRNWKAIGSQTLWIGYRGPPAFIALAFLLIGSDAAASEFTSKLVLLSALPLAFAATVKLFVDRHSDDRKFSALAESLLDGLVILAALDAQNPLWLLGLLAVHPAWNEFVAPLWNASRLGGVYQFQPAMMGGGSNDDSAAYFIQSLRTAAADGDEPQILATMDRLNRLLEIPGIIRPAVLSNAVDTVFSLQWRQNPAVRRAAFDLLMALISHMALTLDEASDRFTREAADRYAATEGEERFAILDQINTAAFSGFISAADLENIFSERQNSLELDEILLRVIWPTDYQYVSPKLDILEDIQDGELDRETLALSPSAPENPARIRVVLVSVNRSLNLYALDTDAMKRGVYDASTILAQAQLVETDGVYESRWTTTNRSGEGLMQRMIALLLLRGKVKEWRSSRKIEENGRTLSPRAAAMYERFRQDRRFRVEGPIEFSPGQIAYTVTVSAEEPEARMETSLAAQQDPQTLAELYSPGQALRPSFDVVLQEGRPVDLSHEAIAQFALGMMDARGVQEAELVRGLIAVERALRRIRLPRPLAEMRIPSFMGEGQVPLRINPDTHRVEVILNDDDFATFVRIPEYAQVLAAVVGHEIGHIAMVNGLIRLKEGRERIRVPDAASLAFEQHLIVEGRADILSDLFAMALAGPRGYAKFLDMTGLGVMLIYLEQGIEDDAEAINRLTYFFALAMKYYTGTESRFDHFVDDLENYLSRVQRSSPISYEAWLALSNYYSQILDSHEILPGIIDEDPAFAGETTRDENSVSYEDLLEHAALALDRSRKFADALADDSLSEGLQALIGLADVWDYQTLRLRQAVLAGESEPHDSEVSSHFGGALDWEIATLLRAAFSMQQRLVAHPQAADRLAETLEALSADAALRPDAAEWNALIAELSTRWIDHAESSSALLGLADQAFDGALAALASTQSVDETLPQAIDRANRLWIQVNSLWNEDRTSAEEFSRLEADIAALRNRYESATGRTLPVASLESAAPSEPPVTAAPSEDAPTNIMQARLRIDTYALAQGYRARWTVNGERREVHVRAFYPDPVLILNVLNAAAQRNRFGQRIVPQIFTVYVPLLRLDMEAAMATGQLGYRRKTEQELTAETLRILEAGQSAGMFEVIYLDTVEDYQKLARDLRADEDTLIGSLIQTNQILLVSDWIGPNAEDYLDAHLELNEENLRVMRRIGQGLGETLRALHGEKLIAGDTHLGQFVVNEESLDVSRVDLVNIKSVGDPGTGPENIGIEWFEIYKALSRYPQARSAFESAYPDPSGAEPETGGGAVLPSLRDQFGGFGYSKIYKEWVGPLVEEFGVTGLAVGFFWIPRQYHRTVLRNFFKIAGLTLFFGYAGTPVILTLQLFALGTSHRSYSSDFLQLIALTLIFRGLFVLGHPEKSLKSASTVSVFIILALAVSSMTHAYLPLALIPFIHPAWNKWIAPWLRMPPAILGSESSEGDGKDKPETEASAGSVAEMRSEYARFHGLGIPLARLAEIAGVNIATLGKFLDASGNRIYSDVLRRLEGGLARLREMGSKSERLRVELRKLEEGGHDLQAIAAEAGVSPSVLERVLNGNLHVSEGDLDSLGRAAGAAPDRAPAFSEDDFWRRMAAYAPQDLEPAGALDEGFLSDVADLFAPERRAAADAAGRLQDRDWGALLERVLKESKDQREAAARFGLTEDRVWQFYRFAHTHLSPSLEYQERVDGFFHRFFQNGLELHELENLIRHYYDLRRRVATLSTDRAREIIDLLFFSRKDWSFAELGGRFGVTRERVRQIEVKAIRTLRPAGVSRLFLPPVSGPSAGVRLLPRRPAILPTVLSRPRAPQEPIGTSRSGWFADDPLDVLTELPEKYRNILKRNKVLTVGELVAIFEADLLSLYPFGAPARANIKRVLHPEEAQRPIGVTAGHAELGAPLQDLMRFTRNQLRKMASRGILTTSDLAALSEVQIIRDFGAETYLRAKEILHPYPLALSDRNYFTAGIFSGENFIDSWYAMYAALQPGRSLFQLAENRRRLEGILDFRPFNFSPVHGAMPPSDMHPLPGEAARPEWMMGANARQLLRRFAVAGREFRLLIDGNPTLTGDSLLIPEEDVALRMDDPGTMEAVALFHWMTKLRGYVNSWGIGAINRFHDHVQRAPFPIESLRSVPLADAQGRELLLEDGILIGELENYPGATLVLETGDPYQMSRWSVRVAGELLKAGVPHILFMTKGRFVFVLFRNDAARKWSAEEQFLADSGGALYAHPLTFAGLITYSQEVLNRFGPDSWHGFLQALLAERSLRDSVARNAAASPPSHPSSGAMKVPGVSDALNEDALPSRIDLLLKTPELQAARLMAQVIGQDPELNIAVGAGYMQTPLFGMPMHMDLNRVKLAIVEDDVNGGIPLPGLNAHAVRNQVTVIGAREGDDLLIYMTRRFFNDLQSYRDQGTPEGIRAWQVGWAEIIDHEWQEQMERQSHRQAASRARLFAVSFGENLWNLSFYHFWILDRISRSSELEDIRLFNEMIGENRGVPLDESVQTYEARFLVALHWFSALQSSRDPDADASMRAGWALEQLENAHRQLRMQGNPPPARLLLQKAEMQLDQNSPLSARNELEEALRAWENATGKSFIVSLEIWLRNPARFLEPGLDREFIHRLLISLARSNSMTPEESRRYLDAAFNLWRYVNPDALSTTLAEIYDILDEEKWTDQLTFSEDLSVLYIEPESFLQVSGLREFLPAVKSWEQAQDLLYRARQLELSGLLWSFGVQADALAQVSADQQRIREELHRLLSPPSASRGSESQAIEFLGSVAALAARVQNADKDAGLLSSEFARLHAMSSAAGDSVLESDASLEEIVETSGLLRLRLKRSAAQIGELSRQVQGLKDGLRDLREMRFRLIGEDPLPNSLLGLIATRLGWKRVTAWSWAGMLLEMASFTHALWLPLLFPGAENLVDPFRFTAILGAYAAAHVALVWSLLPNGTRGSPAGLLHLFAPVLLLLYPFMPLEALALHAFYDLSQLLSIPVSYRRNFLSLLFLPMTALALLNSFEARTAQAFYPLPYDPAAAIRQSGVNVIGGQDFDVAGSVENGSKSLQVSRADAMITIVISARGAASADVYILDAASGRLAQSQRSGGVDGVFTGISDPSEKVRTLGILFDHVEALAVAQTDPDKEKGVRSVATTLHNWRVTYAMSLPPTRPSGNSPVFSDILTPEPARPLILSPSPSDTTPEASSLARVGILSSLGIWALFNYRAVGRGIRFIAVRTFGAGRSAFRATARGSRLKMGGSVSFLFTRVRPASPLRWFLAVWGAALFEEGVLGAVSMSLLFSVEPFFVNAFFASLWVFAWSILMVLDHAKVYDAELGDFRRSSSAERRSIFLHFMLTGMIPVLLWTFFDTLALALLYFTPSSLAFGNFELTMNPGFASIDKFALEISAFLFAAVAMAGGLILHARDNEHAWIMRKGMMKTGALARGWVNAVSLPLGGAATRKEAAPRRDPIYRDLARELVSGKRPAAAKVLGSLERSSVNDLAGLSKAGRKNAVLNPAGWNLHEDVLIDAIAEEIVAEHGRTLGKQGIRLTAERARPYAERAVLNGFNFQALQISLTETDLGANAAIESVVPVSEADPVQYAAQIVAEVQAARKARGMSEAEEGPAFIFAVSNPEPVERIQKLGENISVLWPESRGGNRDADGASLEALASWIKDRGQSQFMSHTLLLPQTLMGHLQLLRSKLGESLFRKVLVLYMDRLLKATPLLRSGDLLRMEQQAAEIAARSA